MSNPQESLLQDLLSQTRNQVDFAFVDGLTAGKGLEGIQELPSPEGPKSPFWPFLPLLQEAWGQLGIEDRKTALDMPGIYPPHREVWGQVLEGQIPERKEDILPGEMEYESRRFREDLLLLLSKLVFPVSRIYWGQYTGPLPASTAEVLRDLAERPVTGKSFFLFTGQGLSDKQGKIIMDSGRFLGSSGPSLPEPQPEGGRFSKGHLTYGLTALHLGVLEDASSHLEPLLDWTSQEAFPIAAALGRVEFFRRDMDKAMSYFQACMAEAQKLGQRDRLSWAYRWMARVYLKEDQLPLALETLEKSSRLAVEIGDPWDQLQNSLVRFMLEDRRRFQGIPEFKSFYSREVERCRSLGAWNYFAYMATNPFGLFSCYDDEVGSIHKAGLRAAARIGNLHRLAVAYQTMGLAAAVQGEMDKTLAFYRRSYKLKKHLGNHLELAYSLNGLGFHCLMTGKYRQALRYFRLSLGRLSLVHDFHEVSMTYFNLAMTALMAGDPSRSHAFLEVVREIMGNLRQKNLKYHSRAGIVALTGVAAWLSGKKDRAHQAARIMKAEELTPFPQKNEEFFFQNNLRFLLAKDAGEPDARTHLLTAEDYLHRTNDDITYMGPFFYLLAAKEAGEEYRDRYVEKGRSLAEKKGFEDYLRWFDAWTEEKTWPKGVSVSWSEKEDLSWMLYSATLQSRMVELHKRTEDIHFLNSLQTILNEEKEEGTLIQRTLDLIFAAMGSEAVYYHSLEPGGPLLRYSRSRSSSSSDFILPQLITWLGDHRDQKFFPPVDNFREFLDPPLDNCMVGSLFIRVEEAWKGHVLLFFTDPLQDEEKIRILSLLSLQIGFGLEKLGQYHLIKRQNEDLQRKNQLLEITSYSDALTGLGNRLALEKAMEREIARHQRYGNSNFSLLFLDLDNFKFFNDTFGHGVGDLILGEVARLIQRILRDTDQAFRYGGDEFITLLPQTDLEGAIGLGRRLIEALEKAESFVSLIQSRLGETVYIPPNRRLSCSAGAAQWGGQVKDSAEVLLEKADKALYEAKKAGKGRVKILDLGVE